ncbi:hypothetical protein K5F35_05620 [Acinetobacter baumannii]|jgi:hypothetical protein|uniref:hypothetical protein n=1 Tax=Acinetobacter TaxID=469 RepID=UPI00044AC90C|nr:MULTISPECIES: hypothetical protein [Acinetobacter]EXH15152.1 hypothetical protein J627_1384 [Acinetobacter sp. 1245593]MBR7726762.1 hypothetical protein [Acinetobacter nosocomialis]MCJ9205200.1 hypothetical protein [Acinetobacter baumannii]MCJ9329432.1 hypothetical protein [Acinetobacter baumannii]MCJ9526862.1 hypothetical protein [Acinetobacter baumannii]
MAYFAVYEVGTGEIQNLIECPVFLVETIHLEEGQQFLKVDHQVSPNKYLIKNDELVLRD